MTRGIAVLFFVLGSYAAAAGAAVAPSGPAGQARNGPEARPRHEPGPPVVVVLGSSTAAGTGPADKNAAWVNRFARALQKAQPGTKVHNLAVNGYTTYHIQPDSFVPPARRPVPSAGHNVSRALSFRPDAIVVNLPSNDQARGYGLDEQMANYERVAALTARAGVSLWVTSTQPRNFAMPGKRRALRSAGAALRHFFGERVLDFWSPVARPDGRIIRRFDSGDGVHLNAEGHRLLSETVLSSGIVPLQSTPTD